MVWWLPVLNAMAVVATMVTMIYWAIVVHIKSNAKRMMPQLPFPDGCLPIVGDAITMSKLCKTSVDMWNNIAEFCDYYKEGFYGIIGHQIWLFMPDHEVVQEVLSNNDANEKAYIYQTLDCITNGVFIAPGIRWRKLRKRLNLTFSAKQLESYMDAVNNHIDVFLKVVLTKIQKSNKFVDIQPYLANCFFDIMTKTHFDGDTDEQVKNDYQVPEIASKILDLLMEKRLIKPHMHIDFLFNMTSLGKWIDKVKVRPYELIFGLIENRLRKTGMMNDTTGKIEPNTNSESLIYVDLVVETLKELNIPVTIKNIGYNSSDLLMAGSDTTSVTAATLLYHLALNKDLQDKLYEEVSKVYGNETNKPLTRQDINSLTHLDMAVNEALRWSSPPGICRVMVKDVDAGKYVVPKNACMYVMILAQHKNTAFYEKADDFYPEHFTTEAKNSRPKTAFIPFSYGPRNCPGKQFAYIVLKALAAVVVNNYILETDLAEKDIQRKLILLTQHTQGYPIRFIPRNHNTQRG